MRNIPWSDEEEVLLVDLYYELKAKDAIIQKADEEVLKLSNALNKRADMLGLETSSTFRNSFGIKMKLLNIQFLDTDGEKGLSRFSDLDMEYVQKYNKDRNAFQEFAHKMKRKYIENESAVSNAMNSNNDSLEPPIDRFNSNVSDDEPLPKTVVADLEQTSQLNKSDKYACALVDSLKRLKKSSREAVEDENSFSEFKRYMHVRRQVEDDLVNTITSAKSSDKKSLILVCGNVGDGKSHLISYLNNGGERILDGFKIHGDATESFKRDRNEREQLAIVLDEFSDDNIDNGNNTKVIVAINLGVLNNFIDSEEGRKFTRLSGFVNSKKILIDTDMTFDDNNDGAFFYVNFGDYHIYRLANEKVESPYIMSLIDRIVTNDPDNSFYSAYSRCKTCEMSDHCPVKLNYEMLMSPVVKRGVVNVVLETIIKNKIILSTRELLNFFYDIIVHPGFDKKRMLNSRVKSNIKKYVEYSLPNIMFDHDDISALLSNIKQYDFKLQRTEKFDTIITRFNTTDDIGNLYREYIAENSWLKQIISYEADALKKSRDALLTLFSRLCKIASKDSSLETINPEFHCFISDLYYANKMDKIKLKNIYTTVERCIYYWNGANDNLNLNLTTDNEDYIISTPMKIEPDLTKFASQTQETEFERFPGYINVTFCSKKDNSKNATISIDYDLYKMLKSVETGYRPSVKDNNMFAGFVSFVKKVSLFSDFNEEITIGHYEADELKKYSLKRDTFGIYSFKEVL